MAKLPKESNQANIKRDMSTAIVKLCNFTLELKKWRSKYRYAAWIYRRVRSGSLSSLKEIMNYLVRLVLETSSTNPRPLHKIPRFLLPVVRWGRKDERNRVAVVSLFNVHRMVYMDPEFEIASITSPFSGCWPDGNIGMLQKAAKALLSDLHYQSEQQSYKWVRSWSAGPNGAPAFEFAYEDTAACFSTMVGHYVTNFLQEFPLLDIDGRLKGELRMMDDFLSTRDALEGLPRETITGGPTQGAPRKVKSTYANGLYSRLKALERPDIAGVVERIRSGPISFSSIFALMNTLPYAHPSEVYLHSKLHFLSDKGGKTRVIAMGDCITQTLVHPIHREIFRLLKMMKTDGTMDQLRQRERVRKATKGPLVVYSVDMKSCTDRLPAIFQLLVLYFSGLLTLEQSVAWYLLMVKRTFSYKSRKGNKRTATYTVGQPMGILSSWAVMALSHHCLVRWASMNQGLESFEDYAILGDDIVIWNHRVAEEYLLLLENLGVQVSLTKTFKERGLAEFAKSYYRQGVDLKPLPASLLPQRPDFAAAMLVDIATNLSLKGMLEWPWLLKTFSSLKRSDMSTIFAVYNVSRGDRSKSVSRTLFLTSVLDFNKKLLSFPKNTDCDAYEALSYIFSSETRVANQPGRPWRVARLWGQQPRCGPTYEHFMDSNTWGLVHSQLQNCSQDRFVIQIVVGENFCMWDPSLWGEIHPIKLMDRSFLVLEEKKIAKFSMFRFRTRGIMKYFGTEVTPVPWAAWNRDRYKSSLRRSKGWKTTFLLAEGVTPNSDVSGEASKKDS